MQRRHFLACSLAGSWATAAEPRLRAGFLGVSHAHGMAKVALVREGADWELVGAWEENAEARARCRKLGVRLVSQRELLDDPTIRVLLIESEVKTHAALARKALEAGKHIHLEKPPADNLRELRELVELAARKRLLMQMGYMWRQNPGMNRMLEAARRGWLGDIYLVRGTIGTAIAADRRAEWGLFPGGHMFELGCHLVDPLVRLLGAPRKVTPFLASHGAKDGVADNNVAVFEFPRALGVVTGSMLQPGATAYRSFEIFGTGGTAVLRPIEPPTLTIDVVKAAGPYRAGLQKVELPSYRRYVGDLEELAAAVRQGRPLSVTPEEDLRVQEALLRASNMLG